MYEGMNQARLDETIEHGRLVEQRSEEKIKLDKKYTSLVANINCYVDTTVKKAYQVNRERIYKDGEKEDAQEQKIALLEYLKTKHEEQLARVERERNMLMNEVLMLKQVQKRDVECQQMHKKLWEDAMEIQKSENESMNLERQKWQQEREVLKEEKKKLEYMLFDLLKASDGNKDKLKRIKLICDE